MQMFIKIGQVVLSFLFAVSSSLLLIFLAIYAIGAATEPSIPGVGALGIGIILYILGVLAFLPLTAGLIVLFNQMFARKKKTRITAFVIGFAASIILLILFLKDPNLYKVIVTTVTGMLKPNFTLYPQFTLAHLPVVILIFLAVFLMMWLRKRHP